MIDQSIIDEYCHVYFLVQESSLCIGVNYAKEAEILHEVQMKLADCLQNYPVFGPHDIDRIAKSMFHFLLEMNLFDLADDMLAGTYLKFDQNKYINFRGSYLNDHVIYSKVAVVGERFFKDAFERLAEMKRDGGVVAPDDLVPASDRIVKFDDNMIAKYDADAGVLIDEVSKINQLELPGIRELIIGNLKAGREMIRSGCIRLYLLQITFLETLSWLAKRYEKEAVGALAVALLDALSKQLGLG